VLSVAMVIGLSACAALENGESPPASQVPGRALAQLRMGMLPGEVLGILPTTSCRVTTLFHGNPAQAWGYRIRGSGSGKIIEGSRCELADFWAYFESGQLIGWTPPR
jgi:hypothetical protein